MWIVWGRVASVHNFVAIILCLIISYNQWRRQSFRSGGGVREHNVSPEGYTNMKGLEVVGASWWRKAFPCWRWGPWAHRRVHQACGVQGQRPSPGTTPRKLWNIYKIVTLTMKQLTISWYAIKGEPSYYRFEGVSTEADRVLTAKNWSTCIWFIGLGIYNHNYEKHIFCIFFSNEWEKRWLVPVDMENARSVQKILILNVNEAFVYILIRIIGISPVYDTRLGA